MHLQVWAILNSHISIAFRLLVWSTKDSGHWTKTELGSGRDPKLSPVAVQSRQMGEFNGICDTLSDFHEMFQIFDRVFLLHFKTHESPRDEHMKTTTTSFFSGPPFGVVLDLADAVWTSARSALAQTGPFSIMGARVTGVGVSEHIWPHSSPQAERQSSVSHSFVAQSLRAE